jgi:hypothetical protein
MTDVPGELAADMLGAINLQAFEASDLLEAVARIAAAIITELPLASQAHVQAQLHRIIAERSAEGRAQ